MNAGARAMRMYGALIPNHISAINMANFKGNVEMRKRNPSANNNSRARLELDSFSDGNTMEYDRLLRTA